jgi:hypothetical protein
MFTPSKDIQDGSAIRAFLTRCGLTDYESLVRGPTLNPIGSGHKFSILRTYGFCVVTERCGT